MKISNIDCIIKTTPTCLIIINNFIQSLIYYRDYNTLLKFLYGIPPDTLIKHFNSIKSTKVCNFVTFHFRFY